MSWCIEQAGRKVIPLSQGVQRFMLACSLEKPDSCPDPVASVWCRCWCTQAHLY